MGEIKEEGEAISAAAWQRGRRALGMAAALLAGTHLASEKARRARLLKLCWRAMVLQAHGSRVAREAAAEREADAARRRGEVAAVAAELAECDARQAAQTSAAVGVAGRATAAEAARGVIERAQLRSELLASEAEALSLRQSLLARESALESLTVAARESKDAARRGAQEAAARIEAAAAEEVCCETRSETEAKPKRSAHTAPAQRPEGRGMGGW